MTRYFKYQLEKLPSSPLEDTLEAVERISGNRPTEVICDRGYCGKATIGSTKISIPKQQKHKNIYQKQKTRKKFLRRAAIEPVISHAKQDFRLGRNYLKGFLGDEINLILAAMTFNMKSWIRLQKETFGPWLQKVIYSLIKIFNAEFRLLQS